MDLSLRFRYAVMILDDDIDYASNLKKEIEKATKSIGFEIAVTTVSTSREMLLLSDSNCYDAYVIDFCYKEIDPSAYSDLYQYQGRDLFIQLQFDKYDELHRERNTKLFYLSSLDSEIIKKSFNYAPASYFCKQEKSPADIASHIVSYFDGRYHADSIVHEASFNKYRQSITIAPQKTSIQNQQKTPVRLHARKQKKYRAKKAPRMHPIPCNITNSVILASGNDIGVDANDIFNRGNKQTVFRGKNIQEDLARHMQAIENAAKNGISASDSKKLQNSLIQLQQEVTSPAPRPKIISRILSGIRVIKGSAEFAAAVAAIIEFLSKTAF